MPNIEQQTLPCHDTCPFKTSELRPCGLGYEGKKVRRMVQWQERDVMDGRQPLCRQNITTLIDLIDAIKPEDAAFTDGDMGLPHMLTISYHTVERGLIPVGGIVDGVYYPIPFVK